MLDYIKQEANMTLTENGAVTYATTGSDCLDLFSTVGALRHASDEEIRIRFLRAYTENPDLAMKLLFFARDIRSGLGERRVFRLALSWLAFHEPESAEKNLEYIAEYGRFDDLLALMDTPLEGQMIQVLGKQFDEDMKHLSQGKAVSLLGKWLPSVNASNKQTVRNAKKLARGFGMNEASYRRAVSGLRSKIRIIENYLREGDYTFDYEKQPSRAMFKYRQAFSRNDRERYLEFLSRVSAGEAKLHAENVSPYELVDPYLSDFAYWDSQDLLSGITLEEKASLNATWESMTEFGVEGNALAVIDTSGSMYSFSGPSPASVALSLGLYFAEHNQGMFHNHFIEFSERPQLIEIKGETFVDRLRYLTTFHKIADTNLEAVFDLILEAALKHKASSEEMPERLIIISDMEFNSCVENASETIFNHAKNKYAEYGYELPEVIFWNVASRNRQQPVTMNEQGVALVSGATPRLFSMVAEGTLSPYSAMLEILGSERYEKISA